MTHDLYTIGYASFSIKEFIHILRNHHIAALVDVRSVPYSRFKPDFKKDNLDKTLADHNIRYIFLGKLVGARVEDPSCYVDGKLNYNLLKKSEHFQAGIFRILEGIKNHRIALMCAEKDPVNCHRMFLVCRAIRSHPVRIVHILGDGTLEEHADTEKRLVRAYCNMPLLDQPDIFRSERERIEDVYDIMCEKITLMRP